MIHEHGRNGPPGCKVCDERRAVDFGRGSREQSFRSLAPQPPKKTDELVHD
jgi:hypothetical protein